MADDSKSLVIRTSDKRLDSRPREGGMLLSRAERMRSLIDAQLMQDIKAHQLARFAFLDNDELERATINGRPLTKREKKIARAMEMSKKEAPVALQFAHDRLINAQRAQQEQKSLSINVERAIIRVPDTKDDDILDAVIIDADSNAPR